MPASSLGTVNFRGRLTLHGWSRRAIQRSAEMKQSPLFAKMSELQKESTPRLRSRSSKRRSGAISASPNSAMLYSELLSSAEAAGFDADKVKDVVKQWSDEAKPYGDEWLNDVRLRAIKAIASSKSLAKLTVELAQEADKAVSEAELETKATVLELAGDGGERIRNGGHWPQRADARHAKIDAHARRRIPQESSAFQTDRLFRTEGQDAQTRTVLMELFTGAQCPPCVGGRRRF